MTTTRSLVIVFLILSLCACCLPAGAILQQFSFRGSVLGFSETNNTVTILATHEWRCEFDSDGPTCTWRSITPQVLTGTAPVPEVFDRIKTGSTVMAGSLGMPGGTWTGIGLLTPPYGSEALRATDLYGELTLLPAPLVSGYGMSATLQPDCDTCSGSTCTALAANLTIFRDGVEVWSGVLFPGEDTQYRDPSDQSGLYVKFVSGQTSSRLCPNATGGMGGPQPLSVFIVHADRAGTGPGPTITPSIRTGSLSILSFPSGATILLDGEERGVTPRTVSGLDPGGDTLVLEKEGYAPFEKDVTIYSGKPTMVTATLEPIYGGLRIQSTPSQATVTLNGEQAGLTPLVVDDLEPGEYAVSVSKPGYRAANRTAIVTAGQERLLYLTLTPEGNGSEKIGAFITALEREGFTVQQGKLENFDVLAMYDAGIIPSCYGNNPTTPYLAYKLPSYPGLVQGGRVSDAPVNPANKGLWLDYFMEPDEAIVYVGPTPPEVKYFSYRSYIGTRWFPEQNDFQRIFASLGDTISNYRINTGISPGRTSPGPYDKPVMIITTADKGTNERVRKAALLAGYSTSMMNDDIIPSGLIRMGTANTSDTITFVHRLAFFSNETLGAEYINSTPGTVLRLTPNTSHPAQPYGVPRLIVRGTGDTHELDLMQDQEELREAIIARQGDGMVISGNKSTIWILEGYDSLQREIDSLGDNRDTIYLRNGNYTLADDEFIIVYGVNHKASGKVVYTNVAVYGADVLNGVVAVTDADYAGSAESYLPGNRNAGLFYVWKFARHCNGEAGCSEVPSCCGGLGIPEDVPVVIGFRAYIEQETGIGPAWNEILYDQVVHFAPA